MPNQEVARQWFVPGNGIDRHVISMDIQRYLGNDATVRPGSNEGVNGYWIKAYRNLTSAMISDLRSDSARWSHERDALGVRDYADSRTFQQGNANASSRRNAESPVVDGPYGVPTNTRSSGRGGVDAMQLDGPPPQADRGRYNQPSGQTGRGYPPDNGPSTTSGRDRYSDNRGPGYQPDALMTDAFGRVPVSQPYQDPRYAGRNPTMVDGAPQGYVRQGEYYVPVTSGYGQPPVMATSRVEPQQYPPGYGQPTEPQRDPRSGRDTRDARDPRYGGAPPDFNDTSRYYPSPAFTAASVGSRDTIVSPSSASAYGSTQPQFDQYGRPIAQPQQPTAPYGAQEPGHPSQSREPAYGRQPAPSGRQPTTTVSSSDRDRDARRRRLH